LTPLLSCCEFRRELAWDGQPLAEKAAYSERLLIGTGSFSGNGGSSDARRRTARGTRSCGCTPSDRLRGRFSLLTAHLKGEE